MLCDIGIVHLVLTLNKYIIMKNYFKIALVAIGLLSLFSCDDDDKKNRLPSAAALTSPENAATDLATLPTLTWVKSIDPDNDVVSYDVYVSESEEFVSEDKMGVKIAENTYTLKTALKPHTKYFWKVVALDEDEASAESEVRYFTTMNSAPAISGLEFPANEATEVEKSINLKWTAADADGDVLKYTVYLAKENTFTDDNIIATDISESEFAVNLDGHTQYFWKLIATDTEGAKIESDVASFTTMNTLPSKVDLTAPANEFDKVSGSVKIAWSVATDADNDAVTYNVFYGTNKEINEKYAYKKGFTENELTLSNLRGNTTYFWKVKSVDSEGGEVSSDVFSFSTINTIPTVAVLNSKVVESIVNDKINLVFNWEASTDADKVRNDAGLLEQEPLVYDVYFSKDATIDASDLKKADHSEVNYTIEALEFETTYFIQIATRDPQGAEVKSEVLEFTTKAKPNAIEGTWTDTRDGKVYKTVTIDGKTWLAENLAYIPYVKSGDKVCAVYSVDVTETTTVDDLKVSDMFAKYGVMYNAYTLEDLAPDGWHVATDADWKDLSISIGMSQSEADDTGKQYDYASKLFDTTADWMTTVEATNDFLFNAHPGGYYYNSRYSPIYSYKGAKMYTYYWTNSTNIDKVSYFYRALSGTSNYISRSSDKLSTARMYVRLVKD